MKGKNTIRLNHSTMCEFVGRALKDYLMPHETFKVTAVNKNQNAFDIVIESTEKTDER